MPYYEIHDKEGLRELILRHKEGLKIDENLTECYTGVLRDIQTLKEEGWCREINPNKISMGFQKAEAQLRGIDLPK
jgi:hypothetical protein